MKNRTVTLQSHHGLISRAVVGEVGDILLVCRDIELAEAAKRGRAPTTVGFKKSSVVASTVDDSVIAKHNGQYEPVATGEADRGGLGPR
jgi:hypothetical protein